MKENKLCGNNRDAEAGMSDKDMPVTQNVTDDQELARLMANLPGMVYRASAQAPFAFEFVGGGCERIYGRSAADLIGRPEILVQTMHPDDVYRYVETVAAAIDRREPFHIEYRLIQPDGTERTVWEQGRPETMVDRRLMIEGTIVDIDEPVHARQLQDATYHISQAAASADNLDRLYERIHRIIAGLMPAENLYIALRDPQTNIITYPCYFDEYDAPPDPETAETGLTAHILRTGTPLLLSEFHEEEPIKSGGLIPTGTPPISWLGVPLQLQGKPIGVIAVQVYHGSYRYSERDRDVLSFVADQIAISIDRQRAALSIQESELRYRSLFEDAPVALWEEDFFDLDQRLRQALPSGTGDVASWLHARPDVVRELASLVRVVDVNRAAIRLAGATNKNDLIGTLMRSMPDEALERFEDELVHIAAGDLSFAWEGPVSTVTGKPLVVSSQWMVAPGKERNLHRVLVAMIDVTDRVQAEHALQESGARLRALFAAMNDVIIILNRDGECLEAVPTGASPSYSVDSLIGRNARDVFTPETAEAILRQVEKALSEQVTTEMEFSRGIAGSPHWLEVRISPLTDDRVLLITHDATVRHAAQESARREASKAETYFNSSGVIMEVTDLNLRLVRLNQTGYDFFGYTPEEIVGKDWLEMRLPERERDRIKALIRSELEGRPIPRFTENPVVTRSGEERIVAWHDSLLRDADGRITGLVSSGVDVTDRVYLEEELQRVDKLESLGTLAGGIAHDFNNMLTGIIGNINLARIEDDADRSRELLQEAEQEILQARGLSQQLLTFAKGGAPVRSVQDVAQILQEAVSFALRGSDVTPRFDLPADLWWANVDKGQLSQVFSNIVINADEAMPAGGTVSASARNVILADPVPYPDLAPGDYVQIDLSDTGTGIAASDLRKIFDPFFSTKRRGSGLGLATSYAIIHKHGGYLGVTSRQGAGTTFSIFLPAAPAHPSRPSSETAPCVSGQGRVLVMDDEPSVRQVVVAMLKKLGYDAEAVPDGASAIHADADATAAGRPFNVIIMDLTIPGGMGGEEAAVLLRASHTPARLIASSGYATDPVMAEYRAYHFDGVLAKPYNFAELTSALASLADQPPHE
ncbi:MAG: PAS domain S-box protein [Caldiserica bacterium]|nr:PAS domain S-box protein [Caldisericota bacterium]